MENGVGIQRLRTYSCANASDSEPNLIRSEKHVFPTSKSKDGDSLFFLQTNTTRKKDNILTKKKQALDFLSEKLLYAQCMTMTQH